MAAIIVTYDVSGSQALIKKYLLEFGGYQDQIFNSHTKFFYNLPSTTLFHQNTTPFNARLALENISLKYNKKLIRCIAFEISLDEFDGIAGEPHLI